MAFLLHVPAEASFVGLPAAIDELEALVKSHRASGDYTSAGRLQKQVEAQKSAEERSRLAALAERHAAELVTLESQQAEEYKAAVKTWEQQMMSTETMIDQEEIRMLGRQRNEVEDFLTQCNQEDIKPKWSKALLNLRVQEEHLIKQKRFAAAAKVKASADSLEEREYAAAAAAMRARQQLDQGKLLARHARELDALRNRLRGMRDEKVISQEREMEKLMNKFKAAKQTLARTHANERMALETALRGWFNPKKFGLPPPPLFTPAPQALSPGQRVTLQRPKRPVTAPGKLVHMPDSPPSTANTTETIPESADQWPDSPIDGQLNPARPRKPWETPTSEQGTPQAPRTPNTAQSSAAGLHRALQPKAHAAAVGIAGLRPYTSHGQKPGAAASAQAGSLPSSPGRPPGVLTKQALQAHTKQTTGSSASVLSSSRPATSLITGAAAIGGSSVAPSQLNSPQFIVLHK